jgi:hypothetical protein
MRERMPMPPRPLSLPLAIYTVFVVLECRDLDTY